MGHVLGLGHPSYWDASIMNTDTVNYYTVQDHDRSDLQSFYPN